MSDFGSSVFNVGGAGSPAIGTPLPNPRPEQEYIASGPGRLTPQIPQMLPKHFDDVTRNFGPQTYEAMLTDPTVYSSFLALKLSILAGSIQVQPRIKPKGYRYTQPGSRTSGKPTGTPPKESKPSQTSLKVPSPSSSSSPQPPSSSRPSSSSPPSPGSAPTDASGLTPDEAQAQELAEFCERELARLRTPIKSTLLQMYDCMAQGSKLAEITREIATTGPDAGKLVLKSIKIKPEWAWQYVVDSFMNVVGIITFVPPGIVGGSQAAKSGGFLILPPEKFAILTWLPKDNDPRGTSALRAAYDWWNLKQQIKPFYYAHLQRFGSPSLDGELSPDDTASRPTVDPTTQRETGGTSSPAQNFLSQLIAFQNNSVIVRPAGSKLNVIEPRSNGEAFLSAFAQFDQQICLAIGLQTRASLEAKHGSKADSDTAENTRGLIIDYGRELGSDWLEKQVLYDSVKLNFGQEAADTLMPCVIISDTEAQDKPAMWAAAAALGVTVGPSQMDELDSEIGLPKRDIEADNAAKMEQAGQMAELAAKFAPPPGAAPAGGQPKGKTTTKPPSKGPKRV